LAPSSENHPRFGAFDLFQRRNIIAEASTSKAGAADSKQRRVQKTIARRDIAGKKTQDRPMQAGARRYPVPPFPKQHYPKPGHERVLYQQPTYDAPIYRGSHRGFGNVVLQRIAHQSVSGRSSLDREPGHVRWMLVAPVRSVLVLPLEDNPEPVDFEL
jgi:hypothetical protein